MVDNSDVSRKHDSVFLIFKIDIMRTKYKI